MPCYCSLGSNGWTLWCRSVVGFSLCDAYYYVIIMKIAADELHYLSFLRVLEAAGIQHDRATSKLLKCAKFIFMSRFYFPDREPWQPDHCLNVDFLSVPLLNPLSTWVKNDSLYQVCLSLNYSFCPQPEKLVNVSGVDFIWWQTKVFVDATIASFFKFKF